MFLIQQIIVINKVLVYYLYSVIAPLSLQCPL